MKGSLVFLILVILFLGWKFVLSPGKLEFTDRAKVLQGLSLALDHKEAVRDYWKANGVLPGARDWNDNTAAVDISQSIVGSIRVGETGPGVISVHYAAKPEFEIPDTITGTRIDLVPVTRDDDLVWQCEGTVPEDYLPNRCRHITE